MKTNKIAISVKDNDEYFEESADVAIIEITPAFKKLVLKTRDQLLNIQKDNSSIYDIRLFDNTPDFLIMGQFSDVENVDSETKQTFEKEEFLNLNDELFLELNELDKARTDVVLLQVKNTGFYWTGVYKHTDIRFATSVISFEQLLSL